MSATSTARAASVAVILSVSSAGCVRSQATSPAHDSVTLRIGFGLTAGAGADTGIQQVARAIALESLVNVVRDGRLTGRLAESWSKSADGLTWHVRLRPGVTFHSGKRASADAVRDVLMDRLPAALGPASDDLQDIRVVTDRDLDFVLRRPSTAVMERLADVPIEEPGVRSSGTGPFKVVRTAAEIEMQANETYHRGRPAADRVIVQPYTSVRSAWADMLRGQVDVLYDVGVDALESLESSSEVDIFRFERGYAYLVQLNVRRPYLRDPAFRRELNAAINREALVAEALRGHGSPADSAVWPQHWAFRDNLPRFQYRPQPVSPRFSRIRLKCVFGEPALERIALVLQRQLQDVGIDLDLELIPGDQVVPRLQAGNFDAVLSDYFQGPSLVRPYAFWRTGAPYNFGGYSNRRVDAALDSIRHAGNDGAYKDGVAAFQTAIVDDPPAIFLAWRERARAVSRRFTVPVEPNTDLLLALHLWRPVDPKSKRGN